MMGMTLLITIIVYQTKTGPSGYRRAAQGLAGNHTNQHPFSSLERRDPCRSRVHSSGHCSKSDYHPHTRLCRYHNDPLLAHVQTDRSYLLAAADPGVIMSSFKLQSMGQLTQAGLVCPCSRCITFAMRRRGASGSLGP